MARTNANEEEKRAKMAGFRLSPDRGVSVN
jgi:hypothetical protein